MSILILLKQSGSWLTIITELITILGVGFAVYVYFRWKHDYAVQKASEYSINLLKQIKLLHNHIEQLRVPKFHNPDTVEAELKDLYIPKIDSHIRDRVLAIRSDLLVAKNILRKHKDLLTDFNNLIVVGILRKISVATFMFYSDLREGKSYKETELWSIIFPSEIGIHTDIKESCLGIGEEVINDEFNKTIEENFTKIYRSLEEEIAVKREDREK